MAEWKSKAFPEGCRECGTTSKTCIGRGLCSTCYQVPAIKARYGPAGGVNVGNGETGGQDLDVEHASDVAADIRGDEAMGQDSTLLDGAAGGPYDSGERAPGSAPSSAPEPGPAPSKPKGLRGLFSKKDKPGADEQRPTKEKPPKVTRAMGRRVSGADTLADVLSGLGGLAVRSGRHVPLGRYVQFTSQANGEILDDAAKGTFIDKTVLQPIAKGRGRFDALGAVFGPPAIILAIEADPSRAEVLMPILRSSIRNALPLMVPAIKRAQEKERKVAEAAADLFPDLAPGEDPVDGILAMMFEGWTPPVPPQAYDASEPNETDTESMVA